MIFAKGKRDKLGKYINIEDDQAVSPNGEIKYEAEGNSAKFLLKLSLLPQSVDRLIFTASIDGNGTMGSINKYIFRILQNGKESIRMDLSGSDFKAEKAIICVEIYRKDEWRISAVANGFNGGLSALLALYGGTEMKPIKEQPSKISLKKGQKVSLAKNSGVPIIVENGWTAQGKDYDLKALVRYRSGKQIYVGAANKDEHLSRPEGAVKHGGDVKNPGELDIRVLQL